MSWDCEAKWISPAPPSTPRPGVKKGALTGPSPTDRAKAGSKHHLLVEAHGLPLTESVTAANVHDTHELFPLVDSVPAAGPSSSAHALTQS
ncbi:transposase [Corallococcus terminator]